MKISKRMVLSSIVCVLPLVVSALLYRQLPNQMPIHWNSVGEANGFIGKNIGAWGYGCRRRDGICMEVSHSLSIGVSIRIIS